MKKSLLLMGSAFSLLWGLDAKAQISSFPHAEDFESFNTCGASCQTACGLINGWVNETTDNAEWTLDNGGTTSSSTGPTTDFNPGTSTGKYLYLETSSPCNSLGSTAEVYAPEFDLSLVGGLNMVFSYHMYGAAMGTMQVDVSTDLGLSWSAPIWSRSGDQTDQWFTDTVSLTSFAGNSSVLVRFSAISGTSHTSDMAIDDFFFYEPLPVDAGIAGVPSPGLPSCNLSNSPVEVTIQNYGTDTLVSFDIDWMVNATAQTSVSWIGVLPPNMDTTIALGTMSFMDGDILTTTVVNPNGISLPTGLSNDTHVLTVQSGLSGTYTIGATGDYPSFNAAISALSSFGVCSAVVFNVEDGVYNEQIRLSEYSGVSAANSITFQSLNGDPSLVELTFAPASAVENYTVSMNGADFITFKDLTMSSTGATFSQVVVVDNGSSFLTFDGNTILGDPNTSTTSTNKATIYCPTGSIDTLNTFVNNNIKFGSYGLYCYGVSTTSLEKGLHFSNNVVDSIYYRALQLYYLDGATITDNYLSTGFTYTGTAYVCYSFHMNGASVITGNNVVNNTRGYGWYLSSCSASANNKTYFANNFVSQVDSSTNTSYGVYAVTVNQFNFMNNSINMYSQGTASRGMYFSSGGNNLVMNNNVVNWGPGYGLYILSGVSNSDYNNVYVPSGNFGYSGTAINTIGNWQSMTGWDVNSVNGDPGFISQRDLHTCNDSLLDGRGVVDSTIAFDIDGQGRSLTSFDIGADEFIGISNFGFEMDSIMKCSTDVVTIGEFQPGNGPQWVWNTGDTTNSVTTSTAGMYTVSVTTACGAGSSSVVVENIPDATADFAQSTSFLTAVLTSTSLGATSYDWDFGDGNTSSLKDPVHVYSAPGQYIVTLIISGECGTDTTTQIFEASVVGVDENEFAQSISVYPNPATDMFTFDMQAQNSSSVIAEMMTAEGKVVWTNNYSNANGQLTETIDVSELATGIYFLKVTADKNVAVKRLVIR